MTRTLALLAWLLIVTGTLLTGVQAHPTPEPGISAVEKTGLYLLAGDYRRALESCEQVIQERPSVEAYVRLTYVYQATDAYLEHCPRTKVG